MRRSAPFILLILALFAMGCLPQATPAAEPTPTTVGTPRIEGSPTPLAGQTPTPNVVVSGGQSMKQYASPPQMDIDPSASYTAVIRTNLGQMTLELFAKDAPKTVNNFVFLAEDGFYDGIIFHRVIPGFMIQGGDPTGTGTSGPGYQFEDEIVPALVFDEPGILAMANSGANTNGSQFFITVVPTPHLNGAHTIFGKIVEGQNVADAIAMSPAAAGNRPIQNIVIEGIDIMKDN
jgi:cyclophilin family peptidyl-prolyl cis-trans isomerase